mgnify:CR=1 FL=1
MKLRMKCKACGKSWYIAGYTSDENVDKKKCPRCKSKNTRPYYYKLYLNKKESEDSAWVEH